ncbi:MAG: ABC transporter ATP-binding protein [Patescibacteria group bacterium]
MKKPGLILSFILEHKTAYAAGLGFLILVDVLQLLMPKIQGILADKFTRGGLVQADLVRYAALIVAVALGMAVFRYFWRIRIMGAARLLDCVTRDRFFRKLQTLTPEFFNTHKTGDLMALATNDIQAVRMAAGPGVVMSVDAAFTIVMVILIMARTIDLRLTLAALAPMPLLAVAVLLFSRAIHHRFKLVQESFASLSDLAQENFSGIRVVKSFVQEKAEIEAFTAKSLGNYRLNLRLAAVQGMFGPLLALIISFSFLIILSYGGTLVVNGHLTLGAYVSALNYLGLLIWPMQAVGWAINSIQSGLASVERLEAVLREVPAVADPPAPAEMGLLRGEIEARDLSFTYPGASEPALRGVSFHLPAGRTLAVVGRTGSGKTTLINLLLRLYNAPRGTILLDGRDINDLPAAVPRGSIGCVPQDNFLFSTTIRENIGFARDTCGEGEIEEAARAARILDEIAAFPEGFETMVGERGVTLSGGQKQRIGIARALCMNPPILILDDCLSAVDTRTEDALLRELRRVMAERTTIFISHRLTTVQAADEILVLEKGAVAERGSHAELLALGGIYAELYQKQLLEDEIERLD